MLWNTVCTERATEVGRGRQTGGETAAIPVMLGWGARINPNRRYVWRQSRELEDAGKFRPLLDARKTLA
ncbi:hypothetical protein KCP74_04275 [Salmonella enterica subsp. enterica]|nr:hypothetical protein KCP74_04275 [Salmonella enterica subsp. enterica]